MTQTLLHHTDDADFDPTSCNPRRGRFDLCLTDTTDVSGYGDHAHEVTVDCSPSGPAEVVEIADAHGLNDGAERIEADSPYFYLLIDDPAVQDALVEAGVTAVRYEDEDWANEPHVCYRILDAKHIT